LAVSLDPLNTCRVSEVQQGTRVEIRNDSDASISRVHAVHLTLPWWHDYVNARGKVSVDPYRRQAIRFAGHAEPGINDISIPPGQNVHYDDAPLSGQTILNSVDPLLIRPVLLRSLERHQPWLTRAAWDRRRAQKKRGHPGRQRDGRCQIVEPPAGVGK